MDLHQQSLPVAEWDIWGMETLLRKVSCESLALQNNKAQCKDIKARWERASGGPA